MLDSLFAQPVSKSSLVYLLVWSRPLHTPYISLPTQCLLFATLAHTNVATCFDVVPRLCHVFLVSLSFISLLGTLSFTLVSHIYLTILISARWSATSFSFLTGQVSLLRNTLLRTQLLHSLPFPIMAVLHSSCGHYIFTLWFLLFLLTSIFFSSPILSRCRLDVYHTSTHGVALVRI